MENSATMFGRVEWITPERAKELRKNALTNRKLKSKNLEKIKRAIITGNFVPTHQGIAIDSEGHMFDGNHRCQAVIDTGISTRMFVVYNAPNVFSIDSGTARTEKDQLYMAGVIEKGSTEWNSLCMPLINFILMRNYSVKEFSSLSAIDKHKAYISLKNLIDDTIDCVYQSGNLRSSAIMYTMACAINAGVQKEVVRTWHKILCTGDFYDTDEKTLLAGRSVLNYKSYLSEKASRGIAERAEIDTLIKKGMSSIDYFSRKESISRLYGSWIYPEIKIKI